MQNKHFGEVIGLGWFIAACIGGFCFAGYKIDQQVTSIKTPIFLLLGALLSFVVIGIKLYYLVKKLNQEDE